MTELFKKFIIEDSDEDGLYMVVAKCTYHKELAYDTSRVIGGGHWEFDLDKKEITLYGTSDDFGPCKFEDMEKCVRESKVFSSYIMNINLAEKFRFRYFDNNTYTYLDD